MEYNNNVNYGPQDEAVSSDSDTLSVEANAFDAAYEQTSSISDDSDALNMDADAYENGCEVCADQANLSDASNSYDSDEGDDDSCDCCL